MTSQLKLSKAQDSQKYFLCSPSAVPLLLLGASEFTVFHVLLTYLSHILQKVFEALDDFVIRTIVTIVNDTSCIQDCGESELPHLKPESKNR